MVRCTELKDFLVQSEQVLRELFYTNKARLFFISKKNVIFSKENQTGLEKACIEHAGLVKTVISTKMQRISISLSGDEQYDEKYDIESNLSALTYPVFDPLTRHTIAVFQIVLWREGITLLQGESIERNIEAYLQTASNFELFFGIQLATFKNHYKNLHSV